MAYIYHYPQPVLELSLESGGSLATGTTYYFVAYYQNGLYQQSRASDQASITTDATNRTIRAKVKYLVSGSTYNYSLPTVTSDLTSAVGWQRAIVAWDTTDFTDGAGNFVLRTGTTIAISFGTNNVAYNTTFTSAPSKSNQYYVYLPEIYSWDAPGIPASFSRTQGIPMVVLSGTTETVTNLKNALIAAGTGFTNYYYGADNDITGMFNIYSKSAATWKYMNFNLLYGNITTTAGAVNSSTIATRVGSSGYGMGNGGINIYAGNNNKLTGLRYRQSIACAGSNNLFTTNSGQVEIYATNNYTKTYQDCYILSNGFNNNNNITINDCILYLQMVTTDITVNNWKINIDTGTTSFSSVSYAYDWGIGNSGNNDLKIVTLSGFSMNTNRAPSEGINYAADKKPRINWVVNTGTYCNKKVRIKNKINFYVYDQLGNAISDAYTSLANNFETLTGYTDSTGYASNYITTNEAVMHTGYTANTYNTLWTDKNDVNITISKYGYQSYATKYTLYEESTIVASLKISELNITNVSITDCTSPGVSDGVIIISASGGTTPYEYSIGGAYQTSNIFSGLSSNSYSCSVRDYSGTTYTSPILAYVNEPAAPSPPYINIISVTDASWENTNDGSISVSASSGTPPYMFSINGIDYTSNTTFGSLTPGQYVINVKDSADEVNSLSGIKIGGKKRIQGSIGRKVDRQRYIKTKVNIKNISLKELNDKEIKVNVTQ